MKRFRLTSYFLLTGLVVLTITAIAVNLLGSRLAEENLTRVTEENTARDAAHMQSMMLSQQPAHEMSTAGSSTMDHHAPSIPLTLAFLVGPDGLDRMFSGLVEGLNIVKVSLFDPNGNTVWSSDPGSGDITKRDGPLYEQAVAGETASALAKDREVVALDGVRRSLDVVETYLPLRESPSGRVIGVMKVYRDVTEDFAVQIVDTKARVLRLTVGVLGGLFFVFSPNPPKDTDGRREDSGRGWVRELQGRWPGVLG